MVRIGPPPKKLIAFKVVGVPNVDADSLDRHLVSQVDVLNAPTIFGGNERNGTYTLGLAADIQQKYRFDLKYIDYFGQYKDNGVSVTTQNGFTTLLKDRGFLSLTFKMTI